MRDALNLRLCSKKDSDDVDKSLPEIPRILREIKIHSEREASIVFLGARSKAFCESAWYINIQALFKGPIFENYNRITLPMWDFGMTYQFDDTNVSKYSGIYSTPVYRTDEGLIFNFYFTYSRFKTLKFSFFYRVNNTTCIYNNNNGMDYYIQLKSNKALESMVLE